MYSWWMGVMDHGISLAEMRLLVDLFLVAANITKMNVSML